MIVALIKQQVRFSIAIGLLSFVFLTQIAPGLAQIPADYPRVDPRLELIETGKNLFTEQQFAAAAEVWQAAADQYDAGEKSQFQKAVALNYVALAYQELEQWIQANQSIAESLQILSSLEPIAPPRTPILAQALNTAGSIQLKLGQPEAALESWEKATIAYAEIGDHIGRLGSQMNQAIALQIVGRYQRSQTLLTQVVTWHLNRILYSK